TRWPRDWSSDVCSSDLSVPLVVEEEILHRVVGHDDVDQSIAIDIDRTNPQTLGHRVARGNILHLDAGVSAHISKSSIAIIVIQRSEEHTSELQSRGHLV